METGSDSEFDYYPTQIISDIKMEDLCEKMGNFIPVHDKEEEFATLEVSNSLGVENLSKNIFLFHSINRYKRYIKYIELPHSIESKIDSFIYLYNQRYDKKFLAKLCIEIDSDILKSL
jgi:hypothetical protein